MLAQNLKLFLRALDLKHLLIVLRHESSRLFITLRRATLLFFVNLVTCILHQSSSFGLILRNGLVTVILIFKVNLASHSILHRIHRIALDQGQMLLSCDWVLLVDINLFLSIFIAIWQKDFFFVLTGLLRPWRRVFKNKLATTFMLWGLYCLFIFLFFYLNSGNRCLTHFYLNLISVEISNYGLF